jgi:hypothetical protein
MQRRSFPCGATSPAAWPRSPCSPCRRPAPLQADPETDAANLRMLVAKLEATGARLVFATTTPVPAGTGKPARKADAQTRSDAAAEAVFSRHSST